MNVFFLDNDPVKAAQMHHDKHVVKMILELAQMLSTAHRILDGEQYIELSKNNRRIKRWKHSEHDEILYKATHMNHPSSVWIRSNTSNYTWAYNHFYALCKEYTHRYGKVHATEIKLAHILSEFPKKLQVGVFTQAPQAMPEKYRNSDSITAYRCYYIGEKLKQSKYTNREKPQWI